MRRNVGIDLGTTLGAVAIPKERPVDGRGQIVVGHPQTSGAGFSPTPIVFAKRSMGVDTTFPSAKQGVLRAEDISAYVLRYLKKMAKAGLGEPVDRPSSPYTRTSVCERSRSRKR